MIMFINLPKHKSAINFIQSHIFWVNSHIPMVFLGFPMVFLWFSYGFSWGPMGFPNSVDFLHGGVFPSRNVLQGWRAFGQISGSQVDVQNNGIASVGEDSDTNYISIYRIRHYLDGPYIDGLYFSDLINSQLTEFIPSGNLT